MLTFHGLNKRIERLDAPDTVRAQTYVLQLLQIHSKRLIIKEIAGLCGQQKDNEVEAGFCLTPTR